MEMTGERRIPAPRQQVWEALNDPEALRASIPGCETVERTAEDAFTAKVGVKLGPMSAKFGGKVKLENINPPASYTISGEGNGGAMGFAKGGADVALEELGPAETLLKYHVKAQVGGKMAQLGARLIDSTAKQMADQFFDRFAARLTPAEPEPAVADAAAPVAGTDTEYLADASGPGPLTQHGAEGPSAGGGKPVHRPNPRPVDDNAIKPLRLMLQIEPFGLPLQFWAGCVLMVAILALMFL
ncbi:CoxG family protein [Dankookia sp. GCM10030260]|uniref:CoxG family protein n=1 Tax=Dankookia sp. GCM10030260 TaxID=3273390 RepID=UPI003608B90D